MNKTGPRRYNNANDIRDAIDRYKDKAQKMMDSAAALDLRADDFAKAGPEYREDMVYHREQAIKKRQAAQRIKDRQLVKLKGKLSEWMTDPMNGIVNDRSIPVKG